MVDTNQNISGAYHRIFVLGSGFSKSFLPSMPTLKDLNALIPEGIPDEFPHFQDYCRHLLDLCNGKAEYLSIEALATSILSTQIFPSERERLYHASLRFELLRFIAQTIRHNEPIVGEPAETLKAFLKSCVNNSSEGQRDTLLLTFNYDTLIENVIANDPELSSCISVDYGIRIDPADRSAKRANSGKTIDLLKLHGSLNWFPIKGATDSLDIRNVCQVEPADRSFPIYCEDTPIYIPMAHAKESFLRGSLFNLLWSKASYYLTNSEQINFLGYGFPQSDINNLEFLLRHRERIGDVVVFENETNPNLQRLRALLGNHVICSDAKDYLKNLGK